MSLLPRTTLHSDSEHLVPFMVLSEYAKFHSLYSVSVLSFIPDIRHVHMLRL
jgi:hypothetical protein